MLGLNNEVNVQKYIVTMLSSSFVQRIIQVMVYNKSAVISSLVKLLRHIWHYLSIFPRKIKTPITVHLVYIENLISVKMAIYNQQKILLINMCNRFVKSTKYLQLYIYSLFGETHGKKFSCFDYPNSKCLPSYRLFFIIPKLHSENPLSYFFFSSSLFNHQMTKDRILSSKITLGKSRKCLITSFAEFAYVRRGLTKKNE